MSKMVDQDPAAPHMLEHAEKRRHVDDLLLRNLPRQANRMTFASMLAENRRAIVNPKAWAWLFPLLCERKDQAVMDDTERSRYLCAFGMVNADGTLGQLVEIHNELHNQHSNTRLLPWHRIFLYLFEEALHHYHPDVCIPYWDWTRAEEQSVPSWLASALPTVQTPSRTITVVRSPGASASLASIAAGVPAALGQTSYSAFASPINAIHGGVHLWVGGTMATFDSPADPLFWLHHANLDRLWWSWYNSAAGNHENPALSGADAVMDPWSYTETDTRDIQTLGYSY